MKTSAAMVLVGEEAGLALICCMGWGEGGSESIVVEYTYYMVSTIL